MIDLTGNKDAARVLENAVTMRVNPKGTRIVYHVGDFADEVAGHSAVAVKARSLFDRGLVHLFQKKLSEEPRKYAYMVEVR